MTENRGIKKSISKLAFALTITVGLSSPAQALLQNEINVGGFTVDSSNAADGFITQSPNYRFLDNGTVRTLSSSNGVLNYEGNPVIFVANAGNAGQILTSQGPGQPFIFADNAGGGGGGGTVTGVTSNDPLVTVDNTNAASPVISFNENLITTIGQAAQNLTVNSDLTTFTNNVALSGVTAFTNGTAAAPSLIFGNNATTGLFSALANPNTVSVAVSGTERLRVDLNGLTVTGNTSTTTLTATSSISTPSADIDGGTLDNVAINGGSIGLTSPATSVNTASLIATTADINGGTIDGTNIGATTAGTGNFTSLVSNGVNLGSGTGTTSTLAGGGTASAGGNNSVAVGNNSNAAGLDSTSVGADSAALGTGSIALGQGAQATMTGSVAIGDGASSTNTNSVAIGPGATTTGDNQIVLGADGTGGTPAPTIIVNGDIVTIRNGMQVPLVSGGTVISEVQVALNPTTSSQTINLGADARSVEFVNIAPNTLKVTGLTTATPMVSIGNQTLALNAGAPGTPLDIARLNLRLTYNNVANTLQVDLINTVGFNAIARELTAQLKS